MADACGFFWGGLWHTMHSFSSGCVFLVAASDYYNRRTYPRLPRFLDFVRGNKHDHSIADPGASYRRFAEEIDEAVLSVLKRGWYILGSSVN